MTKRPTFRGEEPLRLLVDIAKKRHIAALCYRKNVSAEDLPRRLVEPYNLTQGKQDAMVRCYQLEPERGWRFFMIHKLESIEDTGQRFKPKRHITLRDVKVHQTFKSDPSWTPTLRQYRNLVSDALADGVLTPDELSEIEGFKDENDVTIEQMRFVHASIFHRCLGAVLEDGVVDDAERAQIRFLHRVLSRLGWSIAD